MNWVNDYSLQRLNGKRNIPDTFAYMEWLHMLKVRKTREKTMFCTKINSCDCLYVKKTGKNVCNNDKYLLDNFR